MAATKTIGVIGLGSIGMRHKNNLWQHLKQTEVVGYDSDPAKQNGTGWVMGDLDKMIEMCSHIIIASPTNMHWDHLRRAAIAGKDIFVEKPIANTLEHDGEFIEEFSDFHVKMVGYNLRFHSCVRKAKEWLPLIGKPLWSNFTLGQYSEKPPYLRDGVILNWSHEIDLCLYLLGMCEVAASSTRLTDGKDDISDILLIHSNGCRSTIHLDYVTSSEVRQFIIVGTEATILVDLLRRVAWLRDKLGYIIDKFDGDDDWNDNYIEEMQAFLDRCDGKETLGCTAEEGLDVLKICLEVRKQAGL